MTLRLLRPLQSRSDLIAELWAFIFFECVLGLIEVVLEQVEEFAIRIGLEFGARGGFEDEGSGSLKGEGDYTGGGEGRAERQ